MNFNKKLGIVSFTFQLLWGQVVYGDLDKVQLNRTVESLIQQRVPRASVAIALLDTATGQVVYERRADELFQPASTAKLFSATAALLELGTKYRFATVVKSEPQLDKKKAFVNNLYLSFSGDPSLSIEEFKQLILAIKTAGITQIKGDIIVEQSQFQAPNYALGWCWDSLAWYYAAPVTSVILNENRVAITLDSKKLGEQVQVALAKEESVMIPIQSNVLSVTESAANSECQIQVNMNEKNELNLSGCWPTNPGPMTVKVAVKNPFAYMQKVLLDVLQAENIQLLGKVRVGDVPKEAEIIATHFSEPLEGLLKKVLQDSNNLYADSLLKTLGVVRFQNGTFQAGIRAVAEILAKPTGINFAGLRLMDGSGLSTYNLLTPKQLSQLLMTIHQSEILKQPLMDALPVWGMEGTLRSRKPIDFARGSIRAKTGTFLGARALSGFLTTQQQKDYVFVVMTDHFLEPKNEMREFEDELCHLFLNMIGQEKEEKK